MVVGGRDGVEQEGEELLRGVQLHEHGYRGCGGNRGSYGVSDDGVRVWS